MAKINNDQTFTQVASRYLSHAEYLDFLNLNIQHNAFVKESRYHKHTCQSTTLGQPIYVRLEAGHPIVDVWDL